MKLISFFEIYNFDVYSFFLPIYSFDGLYSNKILISNNFENSMVEDFISFSSI